MDKQKENLSIRLYDILIEEAAFGIFDLDGLKKDVLELKNQGAELLWNEDSLVSVGKSTLDVVVMAENADLLKFVLEEFVVKDHLDINKFNRTSETALDQANKIISAKIRAEIVGVLKEYGAKTQEEVLKERNAQAIKQINPATKNGKTRQI